MARRPVAQPAMLFIVITVLLDVVGFGLIAPVLPRLLVEITGEPVSRVAIWGGWLGFVYAAVQFVCAPILGGLSDRFGRRSVLLVSISTLGLDYLVMAFAPTLGWLFLGRTISGIAGASFSPAYAYVADITPPERRAQNFGLISAAFGIGFILGPAIGGLLSGFGTRAPFFVAAGLSLLNFLYGLFVLPESLPAHRRRAFDWRRANPLGTLLHLRRRPAVGGLLAALFLWMVAHQVMPSIWSFYTKYRFAWSESAIGLSLALAGAIMATSQLVFVRRIVPRFGERRSALLGIAIATVGYLGYATATSGWMMYAWLVTWFFGATVMPATNALLSHRVPPDAQGELQGAVASLFSLSSIVGPPLLTQIFARFAGADAPVHFPGAPFLTSALMALGAFLVYVLATRATAPEAALGRGAPLPRAAE